METVNNALTRYQQIVGAYDKQQWERSVERAVLKGLKNVARKSARVNPDLIDVDLVRGSTFSKPKPPHGWFSVSWRAIPRVLFLPLYYHWWCRSTCTAIYAVLSFLYVIQLMTLVLYCFDSEEHTLDVDSLSLAHVLTPCILMFILALLHTQIMASYASAKKSRLRQNSTSRDLVTDRLNADSRRRGSGSEHDSVGSRDTGIDLPTDDVTTGYHPSSDRLLTQRRRSRSTAMLNKAPRVIDADDEADEPSGLSVDGKDSTSAGLPPRLSTRSDSIDKTVEWLIKHTDAKCPPVPRDDNLPNSGHRRHSDVVAVETLGASSLLRPTDHVVENVDVRMERSRSSSRVRLSAPPMCPPRAPAIDHSALCSADQLGVGLRQRATGCARACVDVLPPGGGDSEVSDRRLHMKPQDSLRSLISSGDSESDFRNIRRSKQKPMVSQPSSSSRHVRLCDTRSLSHHQSSVDMAASEWEYTVNTDMTSCDSSANTSASEMSDNDAAGRPDNDSPRRPSAQTAAAVGTPKELSSSSDKVSCMIWESGDAQKVEMTVLDIGWKIIDRVDGILSEQPCSYFIFGVIFCLVLMVVPVVYRVYHTKDQLESLNYQALEDLSTAAQLAFGHNWRQMSVVINGLIQRFSLSMMLFFLLCVAEKTYHERLMYAKNFCYLTSSRRARKYNLPHFRLNKVRTIRSWLSLRSFLKRRGPQRSVENIVSMAFVVTIVIISILCIELLQDSSHFIDHLGNWELTTWCLTLSVFLLRFITLGTSINKKYRNFSVLITEQINLYVHMEQKPHKKEELMIANSVLKLAENLIKELESPFRVSGLSANPLLYNITKVVVLSAFSAVLTELLGFKLKLYKIKMRP